MSHRGTQPEQLDVAALLQAMSKCSGFYHQADRAEFYALVAEDYGAMVPAHEASSMRPHVTELLEFYESVGVYSAEKKSNKGPRSKEFLPDSTTESMDTESPAHSPPDSPRSAHSKSEDVGHTDASVSDSATPVVDDRGDDVPSESHRADRHAESGAAAAAGAAAAPSAATGTASMSIADAGARTADLVVQAQSASAARVASSKVTDRQVYAVMSELMRDQVRAQNAFLECEARLRAERAALKTARDSYKRAKAMLQEERQREKERQRLRRLMDGASRSSGGASASASASDGLDERGSGSAVAKKERKRWKRLRRELSLRFQLMESENERFEMKVEKQMEELRRQYENDVVFPNLFPSAS
ncbi:hypothetical protein ATCC90586_001179 [Pythium insidiosum]|nr:hypothetical protein ATCC90586_001179 [Pythium insidiosum]